MKHQYYGDINDYKKYSLIRHLTGEGSLNMAICWALTEDDKRTDGGRVGYLDDPNKWETYDPVVFRKLREDVKKKKMRSVENLEDNKFITNCKYYKEYMKDEESERDIFFEHFYDFSKSVDMIFFDPDNGLEVKSISRGKPNSSKYIYWDEVGIFFKSGKSILLYQHFPRRNRERYISDIVSKVFNKVAPYRTFVYVTSYVLFLLIPQKGHVSQFRSRNSSISENWGELIRIKEYENPYS